MVPQPINEIVIAFNLWSLGFLLSGFLSLRGLAKCLVQIACRIKVATIITKVLKKFVDTYLIIDPALSV